MTPLQMAVTQKCGRLQKSTVSCSIVKMLLDAGAEPNARDKKDHTPMEKVWYWGEKRTESWQWGIMLLLANHGADFPDDCGDGLVSSFVDYFRIVFLVFKDCNCHCRAKCASQLRTN